MNLKSAVEENIDNLKPPVKGLFQSFLVEISVINPDVKAAICHLRERVKDCVWEEWCDTLISCQDDSQLIGTLYPVVEKLTDMRIVNAELKVMISENKREYYIMALMVDMEAERAGDAYEAEYGADGYRMFPGNAPEADSEETAMPTLQEEKPKPKKVITTFHPEIPLDEKHDFRITDNDLGVGGAKEKYRRNITAIRLLHTLEDENRIATPEEQQILSEYTGWGGLPDAFDESKDSWAQEYRELSELLTPAEYAAARESTLTAFYTPPVVIKAIYKALENMGFARGNILEPSCGVGNFMGLVPESMSESRFYGVELDSISGRIAQQLYQKQNISVTGFENTAYPDSFFDVAIGNVPFGQFKVQDKRYDRNSFDAGAMTKITVNNRRLNQTKFRENNMLELQGDSLDKYRNEYNRILAGNANLSNGITQDKYLTVTVEKKTEEEARAYFNRISAEFAALFAKLGSKFEEVTAEEKLRILFDFFHYGAEDDYRYDAGLYAQRGYSFKDAIAPDCLEFRTDYFKMDGRYGRVLYLRDYANFIKDSFIAELTDIDRGMILSIDASPITTEAAVKLGENKLLSVETNISNWQRKQNSKWIREGAKAVAIYEPVRKQGKDGKTYTNFVRKNMFDISDIKDPEPNVQPTYTVAEAVQGLFAHKAVDVRMIPDYPSDRQFGAFYDAEENCVYAKRGMGYEQIFTDVAVALAHAEMAKDIEGFRCGQ